MTHPFTRRDQLIALLGLLEYHEFINLRELRFLLVRIEDIQKSLAAAPLVPNLDSAFPHLIHAVDVAENGTIEPHLIISFTWSIIIPLTRQLTNYCQTNALNVTLHVGVVHLKMKTRNFFPKICCCSLAVQNKQTRDVLLVVRVATETASLQVQMLRMERDFFVKENALVVKEAWLIDAIHQKIITFQRLNETLICEEYNWNQFVPSQSIPGFQTIGKTFQLDRVAYNFTHFMDEIITSSPKCAEPVSVLLMKDHVNQHL